MGCLECWDEELKEELLSRGLPISGVTAERKRRLVQAILDGVPVIETPVDHPEVAAKVRTPTSLEEENPLAFVSDDPEIFNLQDAEADRNSPVLGLAANQESAAAALPVRPSQRFSEEPPTYLGSPSS